MPSPRPASRRGRARARPGCTCSIVGFGIQVAYFGCSYVAFDLDLSAGAVALITSLQPILVALFAPTVTGEQVTSTRWIGLALGLSAAP